MRHLGEQYQNDAFVLASQHTATYDSDNRLTDLIIGTKFDDGDTYAYDDVKWVALHERDCGSASVE